MTIAETNSVFVPKGHSFWEIGTDKKPKAKAERDYEKRSENSDNNSTFIFVTPLEFQDKNDWCEIKRRENKWNDVRVYDCDDLENWLSIAPSVSTLWVKRIASIAPDKVMPSLLLWEEWKLAMGGLLSPKLICTGGERIKCYYSILDWLELEEQSILRLKSYSIQDGQLFLTACLANSEGYGNWLLRCVTTSDEPSLRQLVVSETPLLIATPIDNAGLARQAIANGHKYCIVTTRSATNFPKQDSVIEIPLRLASYEAQKELKRLGMPESHAEVLLRKTGRMLMALRRELAGEHPCWAEPSIRHIMSSVVLAPGWNEKLPEDREALESLSGQKYTEIEKTLKAVRITPESPLQYVDPFWKLLSPMDAWRCLGPQLSKTDFERFREVVMAAFTSPDPVMDLAPDKRWAAAIYNKRTPYSGLIRKGLLQSLIIIAEFGEAFLLETLQNPQGWINRLVTDIFLACRDPKKWESLIPSLKELAEAAPKVFLDEIERRFEEDLPSMVTFFEKNSDVLFSSNPHVSLIWALERLSWFPEHLQRVSILLVKLHEIDPGGNMNPRPLGALQGIFCQTLPQTMAPWNEQQHVLKMLIELYPNSVFELLLKLIPRFGSLLGHAHKPDWREVTPKQTEYWHEIYARSEWYEEKLIKLVGNDGKRWEKIIDKFQNLQPKSRKEVIQTLNIMASKNTLQHPEAIRNQIRRTLHSQKTYSYSEANLDELNSLETIFNALVPNDLLERHKWLFESRPAMLAGCKDMPHQDREEQIKNLRKEALSEILTAKGVQGIRELSTQVEHPYTVGHAFGQIISEHDWTEMYPLLTFDNEQIATFSQGCIYASLRRFGEEWVCDTISKAQKENRHPLFLAHCCLALPTVKKTWELAASLGDKCDRGYWSNVFPYKLFEKNVSEEDKKYALDKLKIVGRTSVLLDLSSNKIYNLNYAQRINALKSYIENQDETVSAYELQETLNILREDPKRNELEIIHFEWIFFKIYSPDPPQLSIHEKLAQDVDFFKELLQILTGKHKDFPPETPNNAFDIIRSWKTIPGSLKDGTIDSDTLKKWVKQVRDDYATTEHRGLVDSIIGGVLAHSPEDDAGRFPCNAVCEVLENNLTKDMEKGFAVSIHNKRGTYSRSPYEGGQQERGIANTFRKWAKDRQTRWPKVAALLNSIAEDYEGQGRWHDREKLHDDMYY